MTVTYANRFLWRSGAGVLLSLRSLELSGRASGGTSWIHSFAAVLGLPELLSAQVTARDTTTSSGNPNPTHNTISAPWLSHGVRNAVQLPCIPVLSRAFSSGAVKAAQPSGPILAVASLDDGPRADEDPHAHMTPKAVVALLDRYIIGQDDAKRAVAVAYRNRWRRKRVPASIRDDIVPKNILLIGPTGCGKTEIARRLAKLANSPFVKVEATKFTEVGYHGRDVDTIIRDLLEAAIGLVRSKLRKLNEQALKAAVEERILRALLQQEPLGSGGPGAGLEALRDRLRKGELEDVFVEVDLTPPANGAPGRGGGVIDLGAGGGAPAGPVVINLERLMSGRRDVRTLRVREARPLLEDVEAERMFPPEQLIKEAIQATEQDGIVFIDEIDKIVSGGRGERWRSGDPSSEGVQRDLLPIIEGSVVSTKHGNVNTDHILFICAGAFHSVKPSDLMAELQGRLPIRVELKPLTRHDFYRVLTEPDYNLIKQQQVLLAAEGVDLEFTSEALSEMTRVAEEINRTLDNIGARRLHAVLERVVEEVSFSAPELVAAARREQEQQQQQAGGSAEVGSAVGAAVATRGLETNGGSQQEQLQERKGPGQGARVKYVIDKAHVERMLSTLLQKQDLSRYIL
ncbi:hypothetical protein VaNZ11_000807 [Volvox africanus]|uniref:AAA+ ATPase domain-containing protein n=1 Tax=Volvox africanus TaxID=51714 RepID=A0ABQ5RPF4_9CHLO|nr:hypothetical protein VaNZ11_000807 [Volvox africanus]